MRWPARQPRIDGDKSDGDGDCKRERELLLTHARQPHQLLSFSLASPFLLRRRCPLSHPHSCSIRVTEYGIARSISKV
ncbi:hypothetical protein LXL04_037402 [Taraxacum kok-saghyz]